MAFAYLQLLHVPGVLVCFVWGTIIGIFTCIAGLGTFLAFITNDQAQREQLLQIAGGWAHYEELVAEL